MENQLEEQLNSESLGQDLDITPNEINTSFKKVQKSMSGAAKIQDQS